MVGHMYIAAQPILAFLLQSAINSIPASNSSAGSF